MGLEEWVKIKMLKEGTDAGGGGNGCCRMWIFMETHAKCHMWTAWQTKKLMSGGDTQLLGNFLIISKAPVIWGGAGYLGWHTAGVNQL